MNICIVNIMHVGAICILLSACICVMALYIRYTVYQRCISKSCPEETFLTAYKSIDSDQSGVFIIMNTQNKRCYIGSGKNIWHQAYTQLIGNGRPQIFVDRYKGGEYKVKLIPCSVPQSQILATIFIICLCTKRHGYN